MTDFSMWKFLVILFCTKIIHHFFLHHHQWTSLVNLLEENKRVLTFKSLSNTYWSAQAHTTETLINEYEYIQNAFRM